MKHPFKFAIVSCFLSTAPCLKTAYSQEHRVLVRYKNAHNSASGFSSVSALASSPDSNTIACGLAGSSYPADKNPGSVELRSAKTGKLLHRLHATFGRLTAIAFSPDGRLIAATVATGGWRVRSDADPRRPKVLGAAYAWNIQTGKLIRKIAIPSGRALSIAFSPQSRYLAIGAGDTTLRLWDLSNGKFKWVVNGQGEYVSSVAFSVNGQSIVTASGDNKVRLWDTATGKVQRTFHNHSEDKIMVAAFSPTGNAIASAGEDKPRLWDVQSGQVVRSFGKRPDVSTLNLKFSPAGRFIASGGEYGGVIVWDVAKGQIKRKIGSEIKGTFNNETNAAFAFSPNGKFLALNKSGMHLVSEEETPLESTVEIYNWRLP